MIVYAVIGWYDFYPSPDNVIKVFSGQEKAAQFLEYVEKNWKDFDGERFDISEYTVED